MDNESFHVELKCLFCDAALTGPSNSKFESGDSITCNACGERCDYDSVSAIAKETGLAEAKKRFEAGLKKMFKQR